MLALDAVSAESHDAVAGFLRDLVARRLRSPLLVITDGAAGMISAVEQVYPDSLRQRCLIHRCRNVIAKVSAGDQDAVKADFWRIFDDLDIDPGQAALAVAHRRADQFASSGAPATPARSRA